MRIAAYYDIETEDWDTFVCGGYLDNEKDEYCEFDWRKEDEFWAKILTTKGVVLAHNGGRFDHLACLDAFDRYGILGSLSVSLSLSGSSIVRACIRGAGIAVDLADSWKIFPLPLSKLTKGAKEAVGLDCFGEGDCRGYVAYQRRYDDSNVKGCGGYCRIRRGMSEGELWRVQAYCERDVRSLKVGFEHMAGVAETLEIKLSNTIGATTWKTAKAWANLDDQQLEWSDYNYARSGYYGGRTNLFRNRADRGFEYDITSSYPFQCSQPLPTGGCRRVHSRTEASNRLRRGIPGIYQAKVIVPDMLIPPLPVRAKSNGEHRLAYPTGTFKGTWALPDLEYAEELGCKVEPLTALVFDREEVLLADYMEKLIATRLKFGKDTREGEWLKLVANSLYGKFASKSEVNTYYVNPPNHVVMDAACQVQRLDWRHPVYVKTEEKIAKCGHIVWAAYITARARVQLHRMLTEFGGEDALYCDTDSVFSIRERGNVGVNLGDWANKGAIRGFEGIAPKVYRFQSYTNGRWRPKLRAKGVVLPGDLDAAWAEIAGGVRVSSPPRIRGFRSAIRAGRFFAKATTGRIITPGFGDRIGQGDGSSRPPMASELEFTNEIGYDENSD